jgi:hypothetical protein
MSFEDKLLTELKTVVAERADREHARRPHPITHLITRRRVLAGAAIAGSAAAAVLAAPIVTGSQTPAYAVSKNADGSISVKINQFRDPDRLEADLADLGARVDISYHQSNLWCPSGGFATSPPLSPAQRAEMASRWLVAEDKSGFRIYPHRIPAGQTPTVRVDEDTSGHDITWVGTGPPPPCRSAGPR